MASRLLIIQCAALGHSLVASQAGGILAGLNFSSMETAFPALTCPVQGSFRTALPPGEHGMVFNGTYMRPLARPSFWEQSSRLVSGPRIWKNFRKRGGKVGMMFWQQSLGEEVDLLLSPWPVHKHGGGMVDVTYSKPAGLYEELCERLEAKFRLMHYWGPLSNIRSSRWIARATAQVMGMDLAPHVLFTYLPHLDYALQKYPPDHKKCKKSLKDLEGLLQLLLESARQNDYEVLVFGDYAIGQARRTAWPNRALLQQGLMKTRRVGRQLYPDYYESRAFAVVDHEIAHVYVKDEESFGRAAGILERMGSDVTAYYGDSRRELGMDHPNCGDIILKGDPGTWFAYPWWTDKQDAPDYAAHIDIHNKPGYDPCELFFGKIPVHVSTDPSRIQGCHGNAGPERLAAWAATFELDREARTIYDLALAMQARMDNISL